MHVWCAWACSHMYVTCMYLKCMDARTCACVHEHLKLTLRVLTSLYLIHWGRVSQVSPELNDAASLTSQLAPGTPYLCPLSAGTGGRSSCPPGIDIGSGEMQLSCRYLCDKHINHWTIPSPNLCFWHFHECVYFHHIHPRYLLLPPYAELIKKFLLFFFLFTAECFGGKICLCLKGR